jgi:hypothetical protein
MFEISRRSQSLTSEIDFGCVAKFLLTFYSARRSFTAERPKAQANPMA